MKVNILLITIISVFFSGIKVLAQGLDLSEYPSKEISNDELSLTVYLPNSKKGIYRSTRFDWSGIIGSANYKGHEYFGMWKDTHNPLLPSDIIGPAESSRSAGLGYAEAAPGEGFIRLGVGIIEKGNETEYNEDIDNYKILDNGKWKVKSGDDWISFTHTIKSDFGYAYVYKKTIKLVANGFHIQHSLKNTGEKKIVTDQYNFNSFVMDNQEVGTAFHIKYPFRTDTKSDTKNLVKVGGLDVEFLKNFDSDDNVLVKVEGFKTDSLFNKFSIENKLAGAGVLVSTDQSLIEAQVWANQKMLSPQHTIQISVEPGGEQIWTSKYIFFESQPEKKPDYTYSKVEIEPEVLTMIEERWKDEFQYVEYPQQFLDKVVSVQPGDDIQAAIDEVNSAGGGVVALSEGSYILENTLTLKSKVSIIGAGRAQTLLQQGPHMDGNCFSAAAEPQVTDVVIKDLTIKGTRTGRANGILMTGRNESRHTRIMMQNITVSDWAHHGIHIKRTDNIIMDKCDVQYNGAGGGLYHNVYFLYNKYLLQSDCDMSFPVKGKGNKYTSFEHVIAQRITIRDCKGNGIQADHEEAGYFFFHKYNISGCGHAALWFPCEHYYDKYNYTENPKYAPQNVILNRCEIVDNGYGAMWRKVGGAYVINSTFDNKDADMVLFKCGVTAENSTFVKGNQELSDVDEWPQAGKVLW